MAMSIDPTLIPGWKIEPSDVYPFGFTSPGDLAFLEQLYGPNYRDPVQEEPKFTLFPKLPAELRFKIWKEAQPSPHVVDIIFNVDFPDRSMSMSCPPELLFVCRESRAETLKIYKPISKNMKSNPKHLQNFIYIDPLHDSLHFADDWRTASNDPSAYTPLDSIVSWLNEDITKTQKRLAIGLGMLDGNIHARPQQPAFSALAKFQNLHSMVAVLSPKRRQRCATKVQCPYGFREATPPLLGPGEDKRYSLYLSPDVRYAKPVSEGGDPYYAELDEVLNFRGGEDRVQELEDLLEEMEDELDAVELGQPKWTKPYMGVVSLY